MKKYAVIFTCTFLLFSQAFALTQTEVVEKINSVQAPISSDTPEAPNGFDQKGFIGEIIAGVFDTSGKVKTEFIQAFQSILGINDNIPKWTGGEFTQGTIWDKNGNIGIGNSNPQYQFDVEGNINFSGDLYKNGSLLISTGTTDSGNLTTTIGSWSSTSNSVYTTRQVGIGTSNPQSMLHVAGTGRFEGGVKVDEVPAISGNNVYHRAQPSQVSTYPYYGYFEMRNQAGELGAYIGKGNGTDRVDFMLDQADILYMGKADGSVPKIGIGVLDPQAALHVDGDIIANGNISSLTAPTEDNHLTTKSYVDTAISNIPVPGITLHQVSVETDGRTINAHNYCKQQGYTGYFAGMDNDSGTENILCFTTDGIDVTDIGTSTAISGGNTGGTTLPNCSAGEILKHNGTEFVCTTDETSNGLTSGGGGSCEIEYRYKYEGGETAWESTGLTDGSENWAQGDWADAQFGNHTQCSGGTGCGIQLRLKCSGGSNGGSGVLPTCSAGEILRHNGTEFVCGVENTGGTFGGMYSRISSGTCSFPNIFTGSCDCPSGYSDAPLADGISGKEQYIHYCFKSNN